MARPTVIEQHPIYFLQDVSTISPRGLERLQEWVQTWGRNGNDVRYFLAVPQSHLRLQRILVVRLAELQRALTRLGITNIEFRDDKRNLPEPFDTIYVGVERFTD
jgi:hypothetical protein